MSLPICPNLSVLYGEAVVRSVSQALDALLADYRPRMPAFTKGPTRSELTERDALLITYADQVCEPGVPPLRTLADFAEGCLRGVVSGIHILPFYPSSSDDGFAVKDFFAVEPALGTWGDIRRLGESFDLMFDAVFNHHSARGDWFQRFLQDEPEYREFFVTVDGDPDLSQVVRPRSLPLLTEFQTARGPRRIWTTFSADQVDLNFKNPEVLRRVLEALLFYVAQGARFIRLDAIAFLWKEPGTRCLHLPQTHAIIRLMRAVLDEVAPGVRLITETNVPHADNVSYFGDGSNEAHLVYNFALPPLVLHALQTGNAEKLTRWAQALSLPSGQVTFFNFLASHDGIGLNPVRGILSEEEIEAMVQRTLKHGGFISYKDMPGGLRQPYEMNINYLDALSDPADNEPVESAACKFLTAHGILLSLQGVPGIYFHSMFGSRGDPTGAESSGIPRRVNRQKFDSVQLRAELGAEGSLRACVFRGQRELLRVRGQCPALAPASSQRVLSVDPRVFALRRESQDGSHTILALHNVSSEWVTVPLLKIGAEELKWSRLWGSDACRLVGENAVLRPHGGTWLARMSRRNDVPPGKRWPRTEQAGG